MRKISEQEADRLIERGVAKMYHLQAIMFSGFFDTPEGAPQDVVLFIEDDGYHVRAYEDLVRSDDGILVGFVEDGKPPEFEDVFEVYEA